MISAFIFAAAVATCSVENANYQLRGTPTVTARFHDVARTEDWTTGLALQVHVAKSGRSYWFLPWQGGTDGRTNLAWVREDNSPIQIQPDRRDIEIFVMDASYNLSGEVPKAHGEAPTHMLLPEISDLAWHSTTDIQRDSMPRAFFDLVGCKPQQSVPKPQIVFPAVP